MRAGGRAHVDPVGGEAANHGAVGAAVSGLRVDGGMGGGGEEVFEGFAYDGGVAVELGERVSKSCRCCGGSELVRYVLLCR